MKNLNIFKITILILIVICSNLYLFGKNKDDKMCNDVSEKKFSKIIKNLQNDYVIEIKMLQSGGYMNLVNLDLSDLNKSYQDYQADSTKFYQAISEIFCSDYSLIKYLYKLRDDTCYRNIRLDRFDKEISNYNSSITEKMFFENEYFSKMNNVALTLILNYYLNTEQKTIKLLLDAVYVMKNSIATEDLYQKLDKIFEKFGYEDKDKIREAILKDFGKCIDYSQLQSE